MEEQVRNFIQERVEADIEANGPIIPYARVFRPSRTVICI